MKHALCILIVFVATCRTHPTDPSKTVALTYDASVEHDGVGTPLGDVCMNLRALGCPEGTPLHPDRTCFEHLTEVSKLTVVPIDCVRDAGTAEVLRGCGGPSTLRFRCMKEPSTIIPQREPSTVSPQPSAR